MKLRWIAVLGILLWASQGCAQENPAPKTQKEKTSYSLGMDIGTNLKKQPIEIDPDLLIKGVKDGFSGGKSLMTNKEVQETMMDLQKELAIKRDEQLKMQAEKNKQQGEAFLAENKKKEGVVTLPDGLQYKVIKEGTGKKPNRGDIVTLHYRGTLIDGTEIDSSYKRGQAATLPVLGVLPGWTEALQLMGQGAKWQIFIPWDLAYGEVGVGQVVGPKTTLIFEIELISIQEKR